MTEHEWLASVEPLKMLDWLTSQPGDSAPRHDPRRPDVSDRKLRLFACACCRQSWHLITDERSRRAVQVAERYADGKATEEERMLAGRESMAAWFDADNSDHSHKTAIGEADECLSKEAEYAAKYAVRPDHIREPASDANLLRSIVGNPFRPLLRTSTDIYQTHGVNVVWRFRVPQSVVALATVAYEQRTSTGQLDPHNLSILADALEDAGCDNAELLSGLRSPEPRYRGWHVLDAILGKE